MAEKCVNYTSNDQGGKTFDRIKSLGKIAMNHATTNNNNRLIFKFRAGHVLSLINVTKQQLDPENPRRLFVSPFAHAP